MHTEETYKIHFTKMKRRGKPRWMIDLFWEGIVLIMGNDWIYFFSEKKKRKKIQSTNTAT